MRQGSVENPTIPPSNFWSKCSSVYPIQFSRLPYYEHLQIAHLFDIMHIGKNVTKTLWQILDGTSEKERIIKICKYIQEGNHSMKDVIQFHSNRDQININSFPWMLKEHLIRIYAGTQQNT